MRAKDVMTAPVVTVMPATHVTQAAKLLTSHGFTTLPVVDDEDRLLGAVTEEDVLRDGRLPGPAAPALGDDTEQAISPPTVGRIMTTGVVTAGPDTHLATLTRLMLERRLHVVPVVNDGRLAGIVTRGDLLRIVTRDHQIVEHRIPGRRVSGADRHGRRRDGQPEPRR